MHKHTTGKINRKMNEDDDDDDDVDDLNISRTW